MRFSPMLFGSALAAAVGSSLGKKDGALTLPPEVKLVLRSLRNGDVNKSDHTRVKGRHYPQHGKRECARRVRQMAKAARS